MMLGVTMVVPTRAPMVLAIKKDQYGRKPFLILAPLVNAFLHSFVAMFPTSLQTQFVDRMISGSMIFGFAAPAQAAMADLYAKNPKKLGEMQASAGAYFGLGCALGPLIGSKLGGARSFFASSVAFVVTSIYVNGVLRETLPDENRKPFKFADINPVSFLKLFQTKMLGLLTTTTALQSFGDYVNIYDINNLFMIKVLGYGQSQIGNFATAVGVTQILGGAISSRIIKAFSLKTSAVFSNVMWTIGMALMGTSRNTQQAFTALFLWTFGHQRATPVSSYLQKYGAAQGLGKGEIIAAQANLAAYVKVAIPLFYSNLFAWATTNGRNMPGLPYFVICFLTAMSQLTLLKAAPEDV